jgi:hypothetical protein
MEKTNHFALEKENNGFQQILTKFIPYWPLFLISLLISVACLYLYLKFTIPIYETSASVLIKDEKKGQEDSKMEEVLNVFGTKKIVENELRFSIPITDYFVVKTLNPHAPVYERGWRGLGTTSAYRKVPLLEVFDPSEIEAAVKFISAFQNG